MHGFWARQASGYVLEREGLRYKSQKANDSSVDCVRMETETHSIRRPTIYPWNGRVKLVAGIHLATSLT